MQTLLLIGEAEMTRSLTDDKGNSGRAALEIIWNFSSLFWVSCYLCYLTRYVAYLDHMCGYFLILKLVCIS